MPMARTCPNCNAVVEDAPLRRVCSICAKTMDDAGYELPQAVPLIDNTGVQVDAKQIDVCPTCAETNKDAVLAKLLEVAKTAVDARIAK